MLLTSKFVVEQLNQAIATSNNWSLKVLLATMLPLSQLVNVYIYDLPILTNFPDDLYQFVT